MITSSKILILAILLGGLLSCQPERERPNIVVILADDLGYGDVEVYNAQSKIPTPNIDRLAASGMRFTDAHSPSSVCTPTRYGLLTGQYAWRTSLKNGVLWPWDKPLIADDRETLPKMLSRKGYATGCIGKWHLGWHWPAKGGGYANDSLPMSSWDYKGRDTIWHQIDFTGKIGGGPLGAGFDYFYGCDAPNFPPYTFIENDGLTVQPDTVKPGNMPGRPGPMLQGWDLIDVLPRLAEKAVSFIESHAEKDEPFLLYFPLTGPHTPIVPADQFIGKSEAGRYGDFVYQIDHIVGQVVEALTKAGALENTIIVFSSDNGSPARDGENMLGDTRSVLKYGHDPSASLRGMKSDIWEGGHRVPLIVSWPGRIEAGQVSGQLIGLNDLIATFAAIAGYEDADHKFEDSRDFSRVLLGKTTEPVRADLIHHSIKGKFAVRNGSWKFIEGRGSGGWSAADKRDTVDVQLYNMAEDLSEQTNLYHAHPEIADELKALLDQYREQGYSNPNFQQQGTRAKSTAGLTAK